MEEVSPESQEETISFEVIRKIQRSEQENAKLTKLPQGFYEKVKEYLRVKREVLKRKDDRKLSLEVRNIERLVEDIFNRRERKLLNQAIITVRTGIPPENLTEEEESFFTKLVDLLKERREKILKSFYEDSEAKKQEAEKEETKESEAEYIVLVFKEDVPAFIGEDLKRYGPFKAGEVATLPAKNAEIIVAAGKAELLQDR